jgi:two-component system, NarL family, invasion response regulator UvrY
VAGLDPGEGVQMLESSEVASVVRVLTVDDHASFRRAALALVSATDGFEEVGSASSAEDAIIAADALRPDIVLMDIRLPGMDGCEASRRIVAAHPDTLVVLVSSAPGAIHDPGTSSCSAAAFVPKQSLRPSTLREIWENRRRDG